MKLEKQSKENIKHFQDSHGPTVANSGHILSKSQGRFAEDSLD